MTSPPLDAISGDGRQHVVFVNLQAGHISEKHKAVRGQGVQPGGTRMRKVCS